MAGEEDEKFHLVTKCAACWHTDLICVLAPCPNSAYRRSRKFATAESLSGGPPPVTWGSSAALRCSVII